MTTTTTIRSWQMIAASQPMEYCERSVESPPPGEALIRVAGCGVCHTDISFLYGGVATRSELPLTLGHEISGTVEQLGEGVDAALVGKPVVVPAVLPCGECDLCQAGQRRICQQQIMPGNDRHGGFASHVTVPARYLCPVPDAVLAGHELWQLSVVADAITTPFQAIRRVGLTEGELAIVIGAGGIGIHAVQVARAAGAKVIAVDIDNAKLELAAAHGAERTVNSHELSMKDLRRQISSLAKEVGAPRYCWRIFETSGTQPGQEAAFGLLTHGSSIAVVGFTMDKLELRLSNLMAFDATAVGNWGCDPVLYREVLDWLADGRIQLGPFVESHPLETLNEVLNQAHHGQLQRRAVMIP